MGTTTLQRSFLALAALVAIGPVALPQSPRDRAAAAGVTSRPHDAPQVRQAPQSRPSPVQSRPAPQQSRPAPVQMQARSQSRSEPSRPAPAPQSRPAPPPQSRPAPQPPPQSRPAPPPSYDRPAPRPTYERPSAPSRPAPQSYPERSAPQPQPQAPSRPSYDAGPGQRASQPPVRYPERSRPAPSIPDLRSGDLRRDEGGRSPSTPQPFEGATRREPFPRLTPAPGSAGPMAERSRAEQARRAARDAGIEAPRPTLDREGILQRYRAASPDSPAAAREALRQRPRTAPSEARLGSRDEQARRAPAGGDAQLAERLRAERAGAARTSRAADTEGRRDLPGADARRGLPAPSRPSREATQRFIERERSVVDERAGRIDLARAKQRTEAFRRDAAVNSPRFRAAQAKGQAVALATDSALAIGFGSLGCYYPGYYSKHHHHHSSWWFWWGYGGYPYSPYMHPFGWSYWWWWGYWPHHISYWYPYPYYATYRSPSLYYPTVIYNYHYDTSGYSEQQPASYQTYAEPQPAAQQEAAPVGEASAPSGRPVRTEGQSAASQYLTLGDEAFREGRYADAVHYYARAVELAPDQGVLYLVLADGLFATGDYHYGAYALRKALDLDPSLVLGEVDKRTFYGDPLEFDRQIAVLEQYVLDHPQSRDARLMLAANYLFGGRPAAAVDLLESPHNAELRTSDSGALILDAARRVEYGSGGKR